MTKNEFVVLCIEEAIKDFKKDEITVIKGFVFKNSTNLKHTLSLYISKPHYDFKRFSFETDVLEKNDDFELTYLQYLKLRTRMKRGIECQYVGVGNTN